MLFLEVVLISTLLVSSRGTFNDKLYTLILRDEIPSERVFIKTEISNRIHCAALCMNEDGCKGFGFDSQKSCSLMNSHFDGSICSETQCEKQNGVKVYMSPQEITTTTSTTEAPTTSTTEAPTTKAPTKAPTTTSTKQPVTTEIISTKEAIQTVPTQEQNTPPVPSILPPILVPTIPPTDMAAKCDKSMPLMIVIVATTNFFDGENFVRTQCIPYTLKPDVFTGSPVFENTVKVGGDGKCPKNYIIESVKFNVHNQRLEQYTIRCKELKMDVVKDGEVDVIKVIGNNMECKTHAGMSGFFVKGDMTPYEVTLYCQNVKSEVVDVVPDVVPDVVGGFG